VSGKLRREKETSSLQKEHHLYLISTSLVDLPSSSIQVSCCPFERGQSKVAKNEGKERKEKKRLNSLKKLGRL